MQKKKEEEVGRLLGDDEIRVNYFLLGWGCSSVVECLFGVLRCLI
jgi:hypothetical protein